MLIGLLAGSLVAVIVWRDALYLAALCAVTFALTTLPFSARYVRRDPLVASLSPLFLALSALAGTLGLGLGILRAKLSTDFP